MDKRQGTCGNISLEFVKEYLRYCPEEGQFFWIKSLGKKVKPGKVAGSKAKNGYTYIYIKKTVCLAHRLVWFYTYGVWPDTQIDNINGDRSDNRLSNLRLATQSQNACNSRLLPSNKSGYRGVSWNKEKQRWQARIQKDKKIHCLGYFLEISDARAAYLKAAAGLHGEFARPDG
jgi:hypothetical protein